MQLKLGKTVLAQNYVSLARVVAELDDLNKIKSKIATIIPNGVSLLRINISEKEASDPRWKGAKLTNTMNEKLSVTRCQVKNLNIDYLEKFNDFVKVESNMEKLYEETLPGTSSQAIEPTYQPEDGFSFLKQHLSKNKKKKN